MHPQLFELVQAGQARLHRPRDRQAIGQIRFESQILDHLRIGIDAAGLDVKARLILINKLRERLGYLWWYSLTLKRIAKDNMGITGQRKRQLIDRRVAVRPDIEQADPSNIEVVERPTHLDRTLSQVAARRSNRLGVKARTDPYPICDTAGEP